MARLYLLRHPDATVLYVRFAGDITGADFVTALKGAYASPLRREGDASIWDLTGASSVVADLEDLRVLNEQGAQLAERTPPGLIYIVAPQADTYTLARLYSHYGARTGREIEALRDLAEAWQRLNVPAPDYDALRPLLTPAPRYKAGGASARRA